MIGELIVKAVHVDLDWTVGDVGRVRWLERDV